MSVVNVRKMCMLVFEFCMLVIMCVRLNAIPFKVMDMLVVLVMFMFVFMLQRFMQMFMCMVLGQMKPNTKAHQRRSNPKRQRCGLHLWPQQIGPASE